MGRKKQKPDTVEETPVTTENAATEEVEGVSVIPEETAEIASSDDDLITWEKPSGARIKTNSRQANIEKAKELGWVQIS